jgi:hypothetical protein
MERERWRDWNAALMAFVEKLDHKERRQMCPLNVAGIIGASDRKNIDPMAAA